MSVAYIRTLTPVGTYQLVEIVNISAGEAPERPHPQPPLGIWGPPDMPPGFWGGGMGPGVKPQPPFPGSGGGLPIDPGYSPPWAQLPVDPGYGIPEGGRPGGGVGTSAKIIPLPPQDPPVAPPEGMPAGSVQVLIVFPGSQPAMAWVAPYASTGPVTPPATPAK